MLGMLDNLTISWIKLRHALRTKYLSNEITWEQLVEARAGLEKAYDARWDKIRGSF